MTLIGMERERAALAALLDAGTGALVLRGEAGSGKTELLDEALHATGSVRTLSAAGVASESDLPYSGLHQLIGPLLPDLRGDEFAALRSLGSPAADRFAVSTALLRLLDVLQPLVCIVDDADLLDRASFDALAFAARRLHGERVAVLLAARARVGGGLSQLSLERLDRDSSRRLLAAHLERPASPYVIERLLDAAGGNPLALIELPRALSDDQLSGRAQAPDPLPVTPAIDERLARELRTLGAAPRKLLLLAAADGTGDLAAVRRAGERLGAPPARLDEAVAAGLARSAGETLELRHPLLRSVVYHAAGPTAQRLAHALLADAVDDPARRAWHHACAALGTDAAAADELERSAPQTADVLERAASLSTSEDERARRLGLAAEAALRAGHTLRADALATAAQRFGIRVRALVDAGRGAPAAALARLVGADLFTDAAAIACDEGDAAGMLAVAARTDADVFLGLGEILAGQIADAARLLDDTESAFALLYTGDTAAARVLFAAEVASLRDEGTVGHLPQALARLGFAEAADGRFAAAAATAVEGLRLSEQTDQPNWACRHHALRAWAAAATGDEDECRDAAAVALRLAARNELALSAEIASLALGELDLRLGRHEDAVARLVLVSNPLARLVALPSLVEAAVRAGARDVAEEAVEELEAHAAPTQRALLERCRALLAAGADAEAHFAAAARLHVEAGRTFDHARTSLLHGELLRRARRRRDARGHLRAALDGFERLGADGWAARAGTELRGTGLTAQRGDPSTLDRLTPQELQVARLVANGATNKQAAAQLYLSPRTIDFHLRNVFAKLGITSRFQLAALREDIVDPGDLAGARERRAA